ncbi:MAG: peptide chain release factor N(5)-glutamine methyltransferase [Oscillospiraceae bacterium]|nr:peptide chain release factor N(5)-glutamine methyltransferase [Oscillospiraceae bacterium]MCL2278571.1 peptide chain release factor N(5)-glutamine methyltransferase [Oscillospiraceae bacterium]
METYNDIYLKIRKRLKAAGIDSPEFEAKLIVANAAGRSREDMLAISKVFATDNDVKEKIELFADRRISGEPLAYVLGEWEFYGVTLAVNENVLIPRSDTEVLADETIRILSRKMWQTRMLDLCCGSGAVGLAVASKVSSARVVMVDVSEDALAVCRENMLSNNLSKKITAIEADALKSPPSLLGAFDVIACNPPYIPTADIDSLDSSVKDYEPVLALDGGEDGLKYYRSICEKWLILLKPGGHLAFECGIDQAGDVQQIMRTGGLKDLRVYKDTLGIERVITGMV